MAILGVAADGKITLLASNGIARVEVMGGNSWTQRIGYRLRRWLRRPAPRRTLVWYLLAPLAPDEAMAMALAEPSDVRVVAAMGPARDQVTMIAEGAWPSRIDMTVWRFGLAGGTD